MPPVAAPRFLAPVYRPSLVCLVTPLGLAAFVAYAVVTMPHVSHAPSRDSTRAMLDAAQTVSGVNMALLLASAAFDAHGKKKRWYALLAGVGAMTFAASVIMYPGA